MSSLSTIRVDRTWDGAEIDEREVARIDVRTSGPSLILEVDAPFHGDPAPPVPPGRCDGLWEYEVVELFLVGADGRYLELEFGPHGHYLALVLEPVRKVVESGLRLAPEIRHAGRRWSCRVEVGPPDLPAPLARFNAFAIHGVAPHRRFLAASPLPGPGPDFHRTERFPLWPPGGLVG